MKMPGKCISGAGKENQRLYFAFHSTYRQLLATKAYGSTKSNDLLLLFLSDISIIDANQQVVNLALTSPIDDIEDALQYYTALHHKTDFFISGDRKFQKLAITLLPVYSLPQFLKLFA